MISITVAYATARSQIEISLVIEESCTVALAVQRSGILQQFPEINFRRCTVGIHGRITRLDSLLQAGDRIEIYQPLKIDPKQARRIRAKNYNP